MDFGMKKKPDCDKKEEGEISDSENEQEDVSIDAEVLLLNAIAKKVDYSHPCSKDEAQRILNASIREDAMINTESLAEQLKNWCKGSSTPTAEFAGRILGIDITEFLFLTTAPKSWLKMDDDGRKKYMIIFNWLGLPEDQKIRILNLNPQGYPEEAMRAPQQKLRPTDSIVEIWIQGNGEGVLTSIRKRWELLESLDEAMQQHQVSEEPTSLDPTFEFDSTSGPKFHGISDCQGISFDIDNANSTGELFHFKCPSCDESIGDFADFGAHESRDRSGMHTEEETLKRLLRAQEENQALRRKIESLLAEKRIDNSALLHPDHSSHRRLDLENPEDVGWPGNSSVFVAGKGLSGKIQANPTARKDDARHIGNFQPLANSTAIENATQKEQEIPPDELIENLERRLEKFRGELEEIEKQWAEFKKKQRVRTSSRAQEESIV